MTLRSSDSWCTVPGEEGEADGLSLGAGLHSFALPGKLLRVVFDARGAPSPRPCASREASRLRPFPLAWEPLRA